MAPKRRTRRYPPEEFMRRGNELFDNRIRAKVEGEEPEKFVAIDIESGDYEVDSDEVVASDRLFARHPDAQIWLRRVGTPYAHRYGRAFERRLS